MRLPVVLLLSGLSLLGCGVPAFAEQPEPIQVAQNKPIKSHWRLATSMKNWPGKTAMDLDGQGHQAEGHWVIVDISIHNISGEARSAANVFSWEGAELVSANGETYSLDTVVGETYRRTKALHKQFAPGESRAVRLFFDVANGSSLSHINVSGTDAEGDYQTFKVQF